MAATAIACRPRRAWRSKLRRVEKLAAWHRTAATRRPSQSEKSKASRHHKLPSFVPASRAQPGKRPQAQVVKDQKSKRPAEEAQVVKDHKTKRPSEEAEVVPERKPKRPATEAEVVPERKPKRPVTEAEVVTEHKPKRSSKEAEEAAEHKSKKSSREADEVAEHKSKRSSKEAEEVVEPKPKRSSKEAEEVAEPKQKRSSKEAEEVAETKPRRSSKEAEEVAEPKPKRSSKEAEEVAEPKSKRSSKEAEEVAEHKPRRSSKEADEAVEHKSKKSSKEVDEGAEHKSKKSSKEAEVVAEHKSKKSSKEAEVTTEHKPKRRTEEASEPVQDEAVEQEAAPPKKKVKAAEQVKEIRVKVSSRGSSFALAVRVEDAKRNADAGASKPKLTPRQPTAPPPQQPQQPQQPPPPAKKVDLAEEIDRIMNAPSPEELLQVERSAGEEAVTKAWKRLVLLLHPDKLHGLTEETRQAGQEALNFVHMAREEMKRQTQEQCAEVPADPEPAGKPRLLEAPPGARKYEVSWRLPETQDPSRPVEKYEIWGPRYFSEAGDPYDQVLLATLPPLQSHFVLVEEAPTQQDVMWAADRVLRPTLPLTVHAANGKGSSGPLTFELPWATVFPWLQGTSSVLCPQCLRLSARRTQWTRCGGCGYNIPPEATIIVRCPECNGEALWNRAQQLNCSCCHIRLGQAHDQAWRPTKPPRGGGAPPRGARPPHQHW